MKKHLHILWLTLRPFIISSAINYCICYLVNGVLNPFAWGTTSRHVFESLEILFVLFMPFEMHYNYKNYKNKTDEKK